MKLRTIIFALIALSFVASIFAEERPAVMKQSEVKGSGTYGAETLETLSGFGLVKLNGTSITNQLDMKGSLISQNAEIGTLNVMGEANLTGTTVKNNSLVEGSLQAVRSKFLGNVILSSQKAVFTATQLDSITVKKDMGFKGKQIIELKQGSIINGSVHFESGKGEVILFPGCQVLGPVTGGKVIKKS